MGPHRRLVDVHPADPVQRRGQVSFSPVHYRVLPLSPAAPAGRHPDRAASATADTKSEVTVTAACISAQAYPRPSVTKTAFGSGRPRGEPAFAECSGLFLRAREGAGFRGKFRVTDLTGYRASFLPVSRSFGRGTS